MKYLLIKVKDYFSIFYLLLYHLRLKWRLEIDGVVSVFFMMALGLLLSTITSIMYGYPLDFFSVLVTYISLTVGGIAVLINFRSNLTFSRLIYEYKYFVRVLRFMIKCYENLLEQYKEFLALHADFKERYHKLSYDLTVVSTIFFQIFKLYFETMDKKQKNSESYLIDTQEMKNLYTSKEFNDFYSTLFFEPTCQDDNTPYEQVLIHILDEVMTTLYKKPGSVDYYDEYTVFQLVKYILSHWYGNVIEYSLDQKVNEEIFV